MSREIIAADLLDTLIGDHILLTQFFEQPGGSAEKKGILINFIKETYFYHQL